jgi:site-specific recombinase XerD
MWMDDMAGCDLALSTMRSRQLCKTYGRLIGYPMLKPHDLRHGVAMEVLEQQHDLEQVRALLGHARIDTTQIYTMIRSRI